MVIVVEKEMHFALFLLLVSVDLKFVFQKRFWKCTYISDNGCKLTKLKWKWKWIIFISTSGKTVLYFLCRCLYTREIKKNLFHINIWVLRKTYVKWRENLCVLQYIENIIAENGTEHVQLRRSCGKWEVEFVHNTIVSVPNNNS
jgi:hypothetical protein